MFRLILFVGILALIFVNIGLAIDDDDLVAYWPFDDGEAIDATGNGHDGKLVGPPRSVDGKFGKALEFNGKSDYIVVPNHPDLVLQSGVTYAAWFKPSETINPGNNVYRLLSKNNDYFLMFNFGQVGHMAFLVREPGGDHTIYSTTQEWVEGTWYHVAAIFDGKEVKLFINGEMESHLAFNGKGGDAGLDLWIGGDDLPAFFPGIIDDVRVYKRGITDAEVKQVMKGPNVAVQPSSESIAITWGKIKDE